VNHTRLDRAGFGVSFIRRVRNGRFMAIWGQCWLSGVGRSETSAAPIRVAAEIHTPDIEAWTTAVDRRAAVKCRRRWDRSSHL